MIFLARMLMVTLVLLLSMYSMFVLDSVTVWDGGWEWPTWPPWACYIFDCKSLDERARFVGVSDFSWFAALYGTGCWIGCRLHRWFTT